MDTWIEAIAEAHMKAIVRTQQRGMEQAIRDTPGVDPHAAFLTVAEHVARFIDGHAARKKDPRSQLCRIQKHLLPAFGDRTLESLTVYELVRWRNGIQRTIRDTTDEQGVAQASNCLKDLRLIWNKAIKWQTTLAPNLAKLVDNERPQKRDTYIDEREMPRVIQRILARPLQERLFFYALIVTACRPKELMTQKVADVQVWQDDGRWIGYWTKPRGTTKKGRQHKVPIPPKLAELYHLYIQTLPADSDWMFPGRNGHPISKECWHHRWALVRELAGIPHVWMYDLRRTGSTWANDTSGDFAAVSKGMLDHADYQASKHYIQVMEHAVADVLTQHENRLLGMLKP